MILAPFLAGAVFLDEAFLDDERSLKGLNGFESAAEALAGAIAIPKVRVLIMLVVGDCFEYGFDEVVEWNVGNWANDLVGFNEVVDRWKRMLWL